MKLQILFLTLIASVSSYSETLQEQKEKGVTKRNSILTFGLMGRLNKEFTSSNVTKHVLGIVTLASGATTGLGLTVYDTVSSGDKFSNSDIHLNNSSNAQNK